MTVRSDFSPCQAVLIVVSILIALKILLIPTYASTDLEVHRNWLAIVHNLPLSEWYYDSTSEWTLDYPPFFAYFQKALATIAFFSGFQDILILQKGALFNSRVLHFQRLSVIVTDAFYVNSALIYCVLLNFKHIYLYYAPAYVVFFLRCYFFRGTGDSFEFSGFLSLGIFIFSDDNLFQSYFIGVIVRTILAFLLLTGLKLTASIAAPLILSFGPFLTSGGYQSLVQILSRLFPISRGLTHAYWAPNFWAIYNVIDLFLYRVLSIWWPDLFSAPTYCSGIVQVYNHSVLPSITSLLSLACVCASLTPLFFTLLKRKVPDLCTLLSLSAFSFFWFGYHVHEKALLLIVIPLLCLAFTDPKFMRLAVLFSIITATSLFPLLFTTFEIYIKYVLSVTYIILLLIMFSDDVIVMYKKKRCELIEALIKEGYYPVQAVDSFEEIELLLALFDEVVIVEEPYITDYLAVREATPFAELINRVVADHPQFRPDVIICDGNGQFHVRGCGLACHVGALTGIATIGVAKNLNLSLLKSLERSDDVEKMFKEVTVRNKLRLL
ncbi:unnamed protein product [Angiostrongylus costaricensis]|uniref:Alpha-1,3-glucosyltransferase n=1 Tax=Angiostrongylus costaricensis TaxID=334426 RepID=A0A158PKK5_ANGCS|nr:unnamed protein product [Angiostrongylus costaricensis]